MDAIIVDMQRTLQKYIKKDLPPGKIVLLSGPRQVGKTFLSERISDDYEYFMLELWKIVF